MKLVERSRPVMGVTKVFWSWYRMGASMSGVAPGIST